MLPLDRQALRIEHDRGGAAGQRHEAACHGVIGRPGHPAAIVLRLQFVVAHQGELAVAEIEAAHAVGAVGHGEAIVHGVAELRYRTIGEAWGQIEIARRIGTRAP